MFKSAFEIIMFGLMKTIHIKLPNKTVDFIMPKVFGQDKFLKFDDVLNGKLCSVRRPINDFIEIMYLNKSKDTFNISKVLATKPATSS